MLCVQRLDSMGIVSSEKMEIDGHSGGMDALWEIGKQTYVIEDSTTMQRLLIPF